jgi:hypothetical protein
VVVPGLLLFAGAEAPFEQDNCAATIRSSPASHKYPQLRLRRLYDSATRIAEATTKSQGPLNKLGNSVAGIFGPPSGPLRGSIDVAVVFSISVFGWDPLAVSVTVLPPTKLQIGSSVAAGATPQDRVTTPAKEFRLVIVRVEPPEPPGAVIATAVALELLADEIENVAVDDTVSETPDETAEEA